MHNHRNFFLTSIHPTQRLYEALRAFYVDRRSASDIAHQFGWSPAYFRNLRSQFHHALLTETPPQFFVDIRPGPPGKELQPAMKTSIIALRRHAYSIPDIHAILQAQGQDISVRQIYKVLPTHGFPRLPRRTRQEKHHRQLPQTIVPPKVRQLSLDTTSPTRIATRYGGIFLFLPFLNALNLPQVIQHAHYPDTTQLSSAYVLKCSLFCTTPCP